MSQWLDAFVTEVLDDGMYVAGGACRDRAVGLDPQHDVDLFVRDEAAREALFNNLESAGYIQVFACPKGELYTYRLPNETGYDHLSDEETEVAKARERKLERGVELFRALLAGVKEIDPDTLSLSDVVEPLIQPDAEFGLKPEKDLPKRQNWKGLPVHVVCKQFYPDVHSLLHSFDFTCCMFGWSEATGFVEGSSLALSDTKAKVLRLNRLTYPVATMRRTTKFVKYGYKAAEGFWQGLYAEIKNGHFPEDFLVYSLD